MIRATTKSSFTGFTSSALLLVMALGACDTGVQGIGFVPGGDSGVSDVDLAGGAAASGLPCDLVTLLATKCDSCHGVPPTNGAPMSMVTRADLLKPSFADPNSDFARRSVVRMMAGTMPLGGGATQNDIAVFQNWINAGEPAATCSAPVVDSGVPPADLTQTGLDSGPPGTGLPCDVAQMFASRCLSCHGTPLQQNAPVHLETLAELLSPSAANPQQTNAQRSLIRMQAGTMPLGGGASQNDITVLQNWINAGTPAGSCVPGGDGGVKPDPLNAAPTCTSKTTWNRGNSGSQSMNPGQPCIACHSQNRDAPQYAIAGTVYETGHEPDNCNGGTVAMPAGAIVVITDANKVVYNLTVNSVGNFDRQGSIALPYTAKVTYNGLTRAMGAAQTSGDCNSCHTQSGAQNAPGRITLPAP